MDFQGTKKPKQTIVPVSVLFQGFSLLAIFCAYP
ncbi:MAG: hypothetical protein ACI9CZ_000524, partial [Flavobacterium sp.]